jgi:hypothetical protein
MDGAHLFVAVGAASNVDIEPAPAASVLRMGLDGSNATLFATGLRRPGGLAVSPTGDLFVSVAERDGLGDGLVPDFLAQVNEPCLTAARAQARCVCRASPLPRGASACLVRAARCWSGRSAGGGCRAAGRGGLLRLAVLLHGWQAHRPAPHCAVRTERPTARDRRAVGCGARAAPRRSRLRHGRAIGDADGGADGAAERGLSCGSGARPLRTRANARSLRAHPPSRLQTPNARCASARAKPHTRIDRSAT